MRPWALCIAWSSIAICVLAHAEDRQPISAKFARLPLSFEENRGQSDPSVRFLARGDGYRMFIASNQLVLVSSRAKAGDAQRLRQRDAKPIVHDRIFLEFVGASSNAQAEGLEKLPGISNYFIGNDPAKWRTNIPNYAKIRLHDVYPGIDLICYGNGRQLEYDFEIAPGANPAVIRIKPRGMERVEIDKAGGDLLLHMGEVTLRQRLPLVYQQSASTRKRVDARYAMREDGEIVFHVADYDRKQALVIDPVLDYSTYLGGASFDYGFAIAVDPSGNAYVTGATESTNFPTVSPLQATNAGGDFDGFVAKLNASGSALLYSTYLGGSSDDFGNGIAVDGNGNAYVTGETDSTNFPTASPLQATNGGNDESDAFVARLNATGTSLLYSTYLGGSGQDYALGIVVDGTGNAYVTGATTSINFPTASPLQAMNAGLREAFVAKLNASGSALLYSTYLGGSGSDSGTAIAIDGSGNVYVTGTTYSTNFPTVSPVQGANAGLNDAFVAKLSASGSTLLYSTYLGGSKADAGSGISVDGSGNAYVTGNTRSMNFPTASPLQAVNAGNNDVFVAKLTASGSTLLYSTYLGGSADDFVYAIAVDGSGNAHLCGSTDSTDFPTVTPLQAVNGGGADAFVAKLNANASALLESTYLGGSGFDSANGIAVDGSGNVYVAGQTGSKNFPLRNAMQSTGGVDRIFIAKFSFLPADLAVTKTGSPNPAIASQTITYMLNVANNGPGGASSVTLADNVPADTTFVSFSQSSGPAFSCSQPKIGGTGPITCTISLLSNGATAVFSLVVRVNPATPGGVTITNTATVSSAVPDPSAANNSATATTAVLPVSAIPTFSFVLLLLLGAVLAGSASIAMRW